MTKKRHARRRRRSHAPKHPVGLRVQLRGMRTTSELQTMLLEAIVRIEELGISHVQGINLYLSPVSEDGTPLTPVANGQPVGIITINEPYRSAADEFGL